MFLPDPIKLPEPAAPKPGSAGGGGQYGGLPELNQTGKYSGDKADDASVAIAALGRFWQGEDLVRAVAYALSESGLRFDATNRNNNDTVDRGLMQINSVHSWADEDRLFDPYYNAEAAWRVYQDAGGSWSPWYGDADKHMDKARTLVESYGGQRPGKFQTQAAAGKAKLDGKSMMRTMTRALAFPDQAPGGGPPGEDASNGTNFTDQASFVPGEGGVRARNTAVARPVEPTAEGPAGQVMTGFDGLPEISENDIARWTATGLKPAAARGAAIAQALGFGGTVHGVGSRGNKSDHPTGKAIDLMTNDDKELGNMLAAFFVEYAAQLGVKYVIFDGRIASAQRGWEWRTYRHPAGRTDPTARHEDHPHISFH